MKIEKFEVCGIVPDDIHVFNNNGNPWRFADEAELTSILEGTALEEINCHMQYNAWDRYLKTSPFTYVVGFVIPKNIFNHTPYECSPEVMARLEDLFAKVMCPHVEKDALEELKKNEMDAFIGRHLFPTVIIQATMQFERLLVQLLGEMMLSSNDPFLRDIISKALFSIGSARTDSTSPVLGMYEFLEDTFSDEQMRILTTVFGAPIQQFCTTERAVTWANRQFGTEWMGHLSLHLNAKILGTIDEIVSLMLFSEAVRYYNPSDVHFR